MLRYIDVTKRIGPQIRGLFQFLPVYRNIAFYQFFLPDKNVAICYIAEGGRLSDSKHEFDIVFNIGIDNEIKSNCLKMIVGLFKQHNIKYCVKSSGNSNSAYSNIFNSSDFNIGDKQLVATVNIPKAKTYLNHLYKKTKHLLELEFCSYSSVTEQLDELCLKSFGQLMFEHEVAKGTVAAPIEDISSTAVIYKGKAIAALGAYKAEDKLWFNPLMVEEGYRNTSVLLQLFQNVLIPVTKIELGWVHVSNENTSLTKLLKRWDFNVQREFDLISWSEK